MYYRQTNAEPRGGRSARRSRGGRRGRGAQGSSRGRSNTRDDGEQEHYRDRSYRGGPGRRSVSGSRSLRRGTAARGRGPGRSATRGRGRGSTRPRGGQSRTPSMRTPHRSRTHSAAGWDNRKKQNKQGKSDSKIADSDTRLDRLEAQMQKILEALEKGNGPKNRPHSDAKAQQATRFTVQQEVEESTNPDFPDVLKTVFQYIQLTHHYENWSEIPESLDRAIDNLIGNIRPPLPGDGVNAKLKDAGDDFKTSILVAMQAHLHSRAINAEAELGEMNLQDWDTAIDKAKTRYNRRLGKRARPNTIQIALSKLDEVKKNQEPAWVVPKNPAKKAKITQRQQAAAVAVHNSFEALNGEREETENPGDESLLEGAEQPDTLQTPGPKPQRTVQTRKRKPENSPDISPEIESDTPPRRTRAPATPTTAPAAPASTPEPEATARGSQPTAHNRSLVVDFRSGLRSKWRVSSDLPRYIDTVVLADSNGAMLGKAALPPNLAVHVMRGARLDDVARILDQWDPQPHVSTVVVTVGINNRLEEVSTTLAALRRIQTWSTRSGKRVCLVGTPRFPTLIPLLQHCIGKMNEAAADIFGQDYIPAVADDCVEVADPDHLGIHYTLNTARAIIVSIVSFLN